MADVDVQADTGDTLRVHHRDGSVTHIVWLNHGESVLVLPPYAIEEIRVRRQRRRAMRDAALATAQEGPR